MKNLIVVLLSITFMALMLLRYENKTKFLKEIFGNDYAECIGLILGIMTALFFVFVWYLALNAVSSINLEPTIFLCIIFLSLYIYFLLASERGNALKTFLKSISISSLGLLVTMLFLVGALLIVLLWHTPGNLFADPESINVEVALNNSTPHYGKEVLKLKNVGPANTTLNISISGINNNTRDWLSIEPDHIPNLGSGEQREVWIAWNVASNASPGTYHGDLVIRGFSGGSEFKELIPLQFTINGPRKILEIWPMQIDASINLSDPLQLNSNRDISVKSIDSNITELNFSIHWIKNKNTESWASLIPDQIPSLKATQTEHITLQTNLPENATPERYPAKIIIAGINNNTAFQESIPFNLSLWR